MLPVALALGVLAAAGWLIYQRLGREPGLPPDALALERALALPELVALAHVDLEPLRGPAPDPDAPPGGDGPLPAWLRRAGIEVRQIDRIAAAVYAGDAASPGLAAVLLGRFDAPRIADLVSALPDAEVREARAGDGTVLFVRSRDPDTCDTGPEWGVHVRRDRILVADPASVERVLRRLEGELDGESDLQPLRTLRGDRPVGVAILDPGRLARLGDVGVPLLLPAAQALSAALADFDAAYLAAGRGSGGLRVEVAARAADAGRARAGSERWTARRVASLETWEAVAPAAARLLAAFSIEDDGLTATARAELGSSALAGVPELLDDLLLLATRAGAPDFETPAEVDEVDPWPPALEPHFPVSALPDYDDLPGAGAAEAVAGPFGIRVREFARDAALGIELEAVAPALANVGGRGAGAWLSVERVEGEGGRELLDPTPCGPAARRPARLTSELGRPRMRASRRARLRPDARPDEIQGIAGRVDLHLPVALEPVRIEPRAGASAESTGSAVQVTGAGPGAFSYRIAGADPGVLLVRPLARLRRPLEMRDDWEARLPFGGDLVGAARFRGALDSIEVVFASEWAEVAYPFALASPRPGSDGEELETESARFIDYSAEQYSDEFGPLSGRPFERDGSDLAVATAGPFTIALEDLDAADRLDAQLAVLAPDIPNLSYSLSSLQVAIERVRLRDGGVVPAGVQAWVHPHYVFGRDELLGSVRVDTPLDRADEVSVIDGRLVLRLPLGVGVVELSDALPGASATHEGVEVTLLALERDGLVLAVRGDVERLVAVEAFNGDGRPLRISEARVAESPGGGRLDLRVHGRPHRIDVHVARSARSFEYAFALALPQSLPAAPER